MSTLKKGWRTWVPLLLAALLAMHFISSSLLQGDAALPNVKAFIVQNAEVVSSLGQVKEASLFKQVSVAASSREGAYRLYSLKVTGARDAAVVVVRVEGAVGVEGIALQSIAQ